MRALIMLRILIADDFEIVRRGLKQILVEEFPLVHIGEACDIATLLEKAMNENWDLIITDIAMPDGNGLDALGKIRLQKKSLPLLVISTYPAEQYSQHVIAAGGDGYISKNVIPDQLVNAIKQVLAGEKYFDYELAR
jgi:two-component system invasion response regulator UvrY